MYSPSCLRRNRFSAARADGERRVRRKKDSASINTPTTLRTNSTSEERLDMPESIAQSARPSTQLRLLGSDEVFADHSPAVVAAGCWARLQLLRAAEAT